MLLPSRKQVNHLKIRNFISHRNKKAVLDFTTNKLLQRRVENKFKQGFDLSSIKIVKISIIENFKTRYYKKLYLTLDRSIT